MSRIEVSTDRRDEDVVTVELRGELDISNAGRVEQELLQIEGDRPAALVLDLRGLNFMDSTGLRLVVAADARAREQGRRLVLVRGPDTVHRVFKITFVDKRLDFVDDPTEVRAEP